jgi:hypothetical protein
MDEVSFNPARPGPPEKWESPVVYMIPPSCVVLIQYSIYDMIEMALLMENGTNGAAAIKGDNTLFIFILSSYLLYTDDPYHENALLIAIPDDLTSFHHMGEAIITVYGIESWNTLSGRVDMCLCTVDNYSTKWYPILQKSHLLAGGILSFVRFP